MTPGEGPARDAEVAVSQTQHSQTPDDPAACGPSCGPDRRTLLRSAGVLGAGVLGAGALAACGSNAGDVAGQAVGSATDAVKGAIKAAQIPVGGGQVIPAIQAVVTQPKAGEFKAFSAICTHAGCTVADVSNGTINCPCHGSQFDIATGAVRGGPATQPLPPKTVKVDAGGIHIT